MNWKKSSMIVIIRMINLVHSYGIPYDAMYDNTRFIVRLQKTCRMSVLYETAKKMYLLYRDKNAKIDADSTISTFVSDHI